MTKPYTSATDTETVNMLIGSKWLDRQIFIRHLISCLFMVVLPWVCIVFAVIALMAEIKNGMYIPYIP